MTETIPLRVQFKRMTAKEWASSAVILLEGEIGFETDTGYAKFGDGKSRFSELKYLNKPDLGAFAQKEETNSKITKLESSKADKNAVYLKAESKIELDKKLSLTGGIVTGQLRLKPNSGIEKSSSTGGAINIDMSKSEGAGVVVYSNNDTSDGPLMSLRTGKETFNQSALFVDYSGKTNAVNIAMRQPTTPNFSSALNITSGNENGSAMQLRICHQVH